MKIGPNISDIDISDKLVKSYGSLKNMVADGRGIFLIIKPCYHSRCNICSPILMKLGRDICFYNIRAEFVCW